MVAVEVPLFTTLTVCFPPDPQFSGLEISTEEAIELESVEGGELGGMTEVGTEVGIIVGAEDGVLEGVLVFGGREGGTVVGTVVVGLLGEFVGAEAEGCTKYPVEATVHGTFQASKLVTKLRLTTPPTETWLI